MSAEYVDLASTSEFIALLPTPVILSVSAFVITSFVHCLCLRLQLQGVISYCGMTVHAHGTRSDLAFRFHDQIGTIKGLSRDAELILCVTTRRLVYQA